MRWQFMCRAPMSQSCLSCPADSSPGGLSTPRNPGAELVQGDMFLSSGLVQVVALEPLAGVVPVANDVLLVLPQHDRVVGIVSDRHDLTRLGRLHLHPALMLALLGNLLRGGPTLDPPNHVASLLEGLLRDVHDSLEVRTQGPSPKRCCSASMVEFVAGLGHASVSFGPPPTDDHVGRSPPLSEPPGVLVLAIIAECPEFSTPPAC